MHLNNWFFEIYWCIYHSESSQIIPNRPKFGTWILIFAQNNFWSHSALFEPFILLEDTPAWALTADRCRGGTRSLKSNIISQLWETNIRTKNRITVKQKLNIRKTSLFGCFRGAGDRLLVECSSHLRQRWNWSCRSLETWKSRKKNPCCLVNSIGESNFGAIVLLPPPVATRKLHLSLVFIRIMWTRSIITWNG